MIIPREQRQITKQPGIFVKNEGKTYTPFDDTKFQQIVKAAAAGKDSFTQKVDNRMISNLSQLRKGPIQKTMVQQKVMEAI